MTFRAFRRSVSLLLAMAVLTACVNHSYDFDKLEHAVTLGGDDSSHLCIGGDPHGCME